MEICAADWYNDVLLLLNCSLIDTQNRKGMSLRGPTGRGNLLPVRRTIRRKIIICAVYPSERPTFHFCLGGDCHVGAEAPPRNDMLVGQTTATILHFKLQFIYSNGFD